MRIVVCVALLALAACQSNSKPENAPQSASESQAAKPQAAKPQAAKPGAEPAAGYGGDVDRICNAETLSGAAEMEEGARSMHVAQWLGSNIETEEGRQFLAKLARAKPADKAEILRSESARLGLEACALAKAWSGGGQSTP